MEVQRLASYVRTFVSEHLAHNGEDISKIEYGQPRAVGADRSSKADVTHELNRTSPVGQIWQRAGVEGHVGMHIYSLSIYECGVSMVSSLSLSERCSEDRYYHRIKQGQAKEEPANFGEKAPLLWWYCLHVGLVLCRWRPF